MDAKPSVAKKPWLFPLLIVSVLFFMALLLKSTFFRNPSPQIASSLFVEPKLKTTIPTFRPVPRLAYLISGSAGDGANLKRTLKALYHPSNFYVLHLDLEASAIERLDLSVYVNKDSIFKKFGNVKVVKKANLVTYRGPTMVANTLHAAAVLLKEFEEWDWFINLSASDYPLVTQDDILYTLASLPRQLNFIEHTSDIGWKEFQRARPVIVDPGLYSLKKSDVFWVTEKRSVPSAFKLFTGSAWMMLSHQFIEFCIWGWDNLPRTVLMYYANFLSSPEGYFHTVICNAPEFVNTTVNHDLHYISWDNPPKQHPHFLTLEDFPRMVASHAPFARKFGRENPSFVLDKIDQELLNRDADDFVPGGWIGLEYANVTDPGFFVKDSRLLKPGPGAEHLNKLITGLLKADGFDQRHCI